ncbi:MAG: EamA family transporter [Desulforegulaceae bacterium]|nr:EamA family transporter [Desulforegulaceae bacterium]
MNNNKHLNDVVKGRLLIVAASVLWGTSGVVQSYAPIDASPAVIGAFRIFIAGLFITSFSFFTEQSKSFKDFFTPALIFTGLCQAFFQFGYFSAIKITGVAVGVMVAMGSSPVFAGILGVLFEREKLGARWFVSTLLAVSGLFLLMKTTNGSVQIETFGILMALLAGFSYSVFTLVVKRLIKTRNQDRVTGMSCLIGSVFLMIFFFVYPIGWIFSFQGIGVILYLGVISAGVAYLFYGRGLKFVKVSAVGTLTLAEPLTAAFLGVFFFGRTLDHYFGYGDVFNFFIPDGCYFK